MRLGSVQEWHRSQDLPLLLAARIIWLQVRVPARVVVKEKVALGRVKVNRLVLPILVVKVRTDKLRTLRALLKVVGQHALELAA